MKTIHAIIGLAMLLSTTSLAAGTIVLEGKYQDKNLLINNGVSTGNIGFCTYSIYVNGRVAMDETSTEIYEIDFSALSIKKGDFVRVEIKYRDNCIPKIINPEVLIASSPAKSSNNSRNTAVKAMFRIPHL